MASRDKDQSTSHQPLLSSLVVRPTETSGGGGVGGGGNDYEPGEVRRDPPPYSRSDRYDGHAVNIAWCKHLALRKENFLGSASPVHRRVAHHPHNPGMENSDGALRRRGFGNGRDPSRFRDYSPTHGHGRDGERFAGRGYDRSAPGHGQLRVEGLHRNNPNVQPREGDWVCPDPLCKNLNFARREFCNNCNRPRFGSSGSPRRGYPGPPFSPRHHVPPTALDHSPGRLIHNGYRSPPRGWPRDAPRGLRPPGPTARHKARFLDPLIRNDRQDFPEDDPRHRYRYDRPPMIPDWVHRDRSRDSYFRETRGLGRRVVSPPPAPAVPPRGWTSHIRERSHSPVRGGALPKDHQRDIYINRRRDDRRGGVGRNAF